MSFYPLRSDESFLGADGEPVTGFGQTVLSNLVDVELEQNFEYTLNSILLFGSLLLWAVFAVHFSRVESTEPDYGAATSVH